MIQKGLVELFGSKIVLKKCVNMKNIYEIFLEQHFPSNWVRGISFKLICKSDTYPLFLITRLGFVT
jgi:hypothetical protein